MKQALLASLALALLSSVAHAASIEVTITPTDTAVDGSVLPATGPGSILSHRVQVGTCVGTAFGSVLASRVVDMPALTTTFSGLPVGVLCVRAFASNEYGEGPSYPVRLQGSVPGKEGSIAVRQVIP